MVWKQRGKLTLNGSKKGKIGPDIKEKNISHVGEICWMQLVNDKRIKGGRETRVL